MSLCSCVTQGRFMTTAIFFFVTGLPLEVRRQGKCVSDAQNPRGSGEPKGVLEKKNDNHHNDTPSPWQPSGVDQYPYYSTVMLPFTIQWRGFLIPDFHWLSHWKKVDGKGKI